MATTSASATITSCSAAAVQADLNNGGTYTFGSSCTLSLTAPLTMSGGSVTLDGTGQSVDIDGGSSSQLFLVTGGSLTLKGITLSGGSVTGSAGTQAPSQTGQNGGDGGEARGGAMKISAGATVDLEGDTVEDNTAEGGGGGDGGYPGNTPINGGNGGNGGVAEGGAIYNAGTLVVQDASFVGNDAFGGSGGGAGAGGGFSGSSAGNSGPGGLGGAAQGGSIYNTGSLHLTGTSFSTGDARGGSGGPGAIGGYAHGAAGNGGPGGNGGDGEGGAIFDVGSMTASTTSFEHLSAIGGDGGQGGNSGMNTDAGTTGSIGPGGNGGDAIHGAVDSASGGQFLGCGNTVTAGQGGLGGGISGGGPPGQGQPGSPGTATDPDNGGDCSATKISGQVTGAGTGQPVSGVTVTATGPTTAQGTTDQNGDYSLSVSAGSYTVTPSGLHATYQPGSATADTTQGNQTVNFQMGYKVSGTVVEDCPKCAQSEPLPNASITAMPTSGSGSGNSATSGSDGTYTMLLGPASWELTGSDSGFNFFPASGKLKVSADRAGIDFWACPSGSASGRPPSVDDWVGTTRTKSLAQSGCKWPVQARVKLPNGEPVGGAPVRASSNDYWFGSETDRASTNSAGLALFLLDPGSWSLTPTETHSAHTHSGVSVSYIDTAPLCHEQRQRLGGGSAPPPAVDSCTILLGGDETVDTLNFEAPDALIEGTVSGKSTKGSVTIRASDPSSDSPSASTVYGDGGVAIPGSYSFWAYARSRSGLPAVIQTLSRVRPKVTRCSPGTIRGATCVPSGAGSSSGLVLGVTYHVNFKFP